MGESRNFERLLEAAGLIVRHADFPGKRQVLEKCREEVEDLTSVGSLTSDQSAMLRQVLVSASLDAGS